MKKLLMFFLIAVLSVGLFAGCGSNNAENAGNTKETTNAKEENKNDESKNDKKIHIAYTTMDLSNPYFIHMVKGMEEKADELGVEITVHDGKGDAASQISAVENFIVQKVDAVIISANDAEALQPMVEKAHEAGISVLTANVPLENSDAHFDLIQYDYGFMGGEIAGNWIKEKLNGEAEVAVFGYSQIPIVKERVNGIIDGIKSIAPNAKIVAEQDAQTTELGLKVTEAILQANPNVKVIVGMNDAGPLGAFEAVKAAGKDSDDFCIVGLDAVPEALEKIKEGSIYRGTVDISPYDTGKLMVETTLKVIDGEKFEELIKFPMVPVTTENIDEYIK